MNEILHLKLSYLTNVDDDRIRSKVQNKLHDFRNEDHLSH